MDKLNLDKAKKNKYSKVLSLFYKKITDMTNHIEYLFKNKYIEQEFYIEKMYIFNEIHYKLNVLESNLNQKKINKKFIDSYINDINELFGSVCVHIGSKNIQSVLSIFINLNEFLENSSNEFNILFDIYNDYFDQIHTKTAEVNLSILNFQMSNITTPCEECVSGPPECKCNIPGENYYWY